MSISNFFPDDVELNKPVDIRSGCVKCKLYKQKNLKTPFMKPHGKFHKEILIWGEGPGKEEDERGYQFCGESGQLLEDTFYKFGINLHKDCLKTNAVDCRPPGNRTPTNTEMKLCFPRKENLLANYKPRIILLLGKAAIDSFYRFDSQRQHFINEISSLRGKIIPDKFLNSWVCHSYHPSFILRGNEDKIAVFEKDIETVKICLKRERPKKYLKNKFDYVSVTKFKKLQRLLNDVIDYNMTVVFDYETSSYRYYEGIHKLYLISFQTDRDGDYISANTVYCFPIEMTDDNNKPFWTKKQLAIIKKLWKTILSYNKLVAQNIQHEYQASNAFFDLNKRRFKRNFIWDTMLGCRTLDEAKKVTGLKMQSYHVFGQEHYAVDKKYMEPSSKNKLNKFNEFPFEKAVRYCSVDTYNTKQLWLYQKELIEKKDMKQAYTLLHNASLEFADMTEVGIRINKRKLERMTRKTKERVKELKEKLLSHKDAAKFKRDTGRALKIDQATSPEDLKHLLFNILKLPSAKSTAKGNPSLSADILDHYRKKSSFIDTELRFRKETKMLGVLNNFTKNMVGEYIHPSFLLNTTRTYRSSSKDPNFQNIPIRDQSLKSVRKLIIPRKGNVLIEVDYESMEVRIIACWSKDSTLCKFVEEGFDFHAEWTRRNLRIEPREFKKADWKKLRFGVKNSFVFALFYGSYYANIAPNLWDYVKTIGMGDILPSYTTFENHLKKQESDFWKMFNGVKKAQEHAFKWYKDHGYIKQIGWGFERHGYLSRNKIANTHIQGPAFQCLLWSINRIGKIKHKFNSIFPGQIHDSLFIDADPKEKNKLHRTVSNIMENEIREKNKWLIVPLSTEWTVGKNWAEMEVVK